MKKLLCTLSATLVLALTVGAQDKLVVWNGEDAAKGHGWSAPKNDDNSFKAQKETARSGDTALELKLKGDAWFGGGFNWHDWWPETAGNDTSAFTHLVFACKIKGDLDANIGVSLGSNNRNSTEPVLLSTYAKDVNLRDGEWHEITIPLADFKSAEGKPFDRKAVWEIGFGSWQQDSRSFSLFLDDITFVKREAKTE